MPFFIGVDGGGSKTVFALSYADGIPITQTESIGCSYQSVGLERAADIIADGILKCTAQAGVQLENCVYCCIGIPCWGENAESDFALFEMLKQKLPGLPIRAVNDVEVAWAGAQECQPGIHIVAGTGSITYGIAPDGKTARCGGWNEFFGDEGSCYWVGRKGMELFSKEADGRIPKGPLYSIVKQELHLADDYCFIDEVVTKIAPYRDKVAAFQKYVLAAATAGDVAAIRLYMEASIELALLVKALAAQLDFENKSFNVTYSGGLFHAGTFILEPLRIEITKAGGTLCNPRLTAQEGALLMAINQFKEETSCI